MNHPTSLTDAATIGGDQVMLDTPGNGKLAGAKEALKKKLMRLVLHQALEELGNDESIAERAIAGVDPTMMATLSERVRNAITDKAVADVTSQGPDDLSANVLAQIESGPSVSDAATQVERKILGTIAQKALEGLEDDGDTVRTAFESIVSANEGAIVDMSDRVRARLAGSIADRAWDGGINAEDVVRVASERLDDENPAVADAVAQVKESASGLILDYVLSQAASPDSRLAETIAESVREKLADSVRERVFGDPPEVLAREISAEIGADHEVVVSAVRKTRLHLLQSIRERAIGSIEDPKSAAREAMLHVDDDHDAVAGASTALVQKLRQLIADRAVAELGSAETAAAAAMNIAAQQGSTLRTAATSVFESLARQVADDARTRCGDPDALSEAARDYMDPKDAQVARAVSLLQARLTELVAHRAVATLEEDDRVQAMAYEAVSRQSPILDETVVILKDQIEKDIVNRVSESFTDAGDTARRAKERLGAGNSTMIAASEILKEMVMEELAKQATVTLLDPDQAAANAFDRIDVHDPRFERAADTVRERLIDAVAERSLNEIGQSDSAASEARGRIVDNHEAIIGATAVLRDMLLDDIARRSEAALEDTRAVAQQSRGRISEDSPSMARAGEQLRTMLLDDMVTMTRAALEDAEAAATDAMQYVDAKDEVFAKARAVFKERLLINVLGEAMREIGHDMGGGSSAQAPMLQQALRGMQRETSPAGAPPYVPETPVERSETPRTTTASEQTHTQEAAAPTPATPAAAPQAPSADASQAHSAESFRAPAETPTQTPNRRKAEATHKDEAPIIASTPFMEPASTGGWVKLSDFDDDSDRIVALDPPEPADDFIVTEILDERPDSATDADDFDDSIMFSWDVEYDPSSADVAEDPVIADQPDSNDASAPSMADLAEEAAAIEPEPIEKSMPEPLEDVDMTWASDDGTRCYIYGYVAAPEVGAKPPAGVVGLADDPVRFVTLRGIRAIISKVPSDSFDSEPLARLSKDAAWLKGQIRAHARVLDGFKELGTVVPIRFGSVYDNEADVAVMMGAEYDEISETIDRLRNKHEWSVRVTRDLERLNVKIAESGRTVQDSLGAVSTGVAQYIRDEMEKAGELTDEELLDTLTSNCIRRAHNALMPWSVEGAEKPLVQQAGIDLVFNAAYLVEHSRTADFKQELATLSSELEPIGLTFDVTGPWPAYHFVDANDQSSAEPVSETA